MVFRETISRETEVDYIHKRHTPPPSFYARVKLRLQPLERGAGFAFKNQVKEGTIPARWIGSVERGVLEAAKTGVLNNGPVVDCRVTVFDGAYHDVDSNDEAFFIAAQKAFWEGMKKAGPELVKTKLRLAVDNNTVRD